MRVRKSANLTGAAKARAEHKSLGINKTSKRMKSQSTQLSDLENMKTAAQMRIRGATYNMIAEALDCDPGKAMSLVARAFEYQSAAVTELISDYMRDALARYDAFLRAWYVRAFGGFEIDPVTNQQVRVHPSEEAGRLFLRAQRDLMSMLLKAQPAKVEITGAAGGPIMTSNVDAMEMARIMRSEFGEGNSWTVSESESEPETNGRTH